MPQLIGSSMAVVGSTDDVHDSALNPLFSRASDANGNVYIYLKGVADVAAGSWVNYDVGTDGVVALLDTDVAGTLIGRIAVAMAAVVANKYGWFAIYGSSIVGKSLASATDTKNAFAVSTAGSVDDSGAGAEALVFGAFYQSAVDTPTSGHSYFALNFPYMTGLTLD